MGPLELVRHKSGLSNVLHIWAGFCMWEVLSGLLGAPHRGKCFRKLADHCLWCVTRVYVFAAHHTFNFFKNVCVCVSLPKTVMPCKFYFLKLNEWFWFVITSLANAAFILAPSPSVLPGAAGSNRPWMKYLFQRLISALCSYSSMMLFLLAHNGFHINHHCQRATVTVYLNRVISKYSPSHTALSG